MSGKYKVELRAVVDINIPDATSAEDAENKAVDIMYALDTQHYDMQKLRVINTTPVSHWCYECGGELEITLTKREYFSVDGFTGDFKQKVNKSVDTTVSCISCGIVIDDPRIDWCESRLL